MNMNGSYGGLTLKLCVLLAALLAAPPADVRGRAPRASCPSVNVVCPDAVTTGVPVTFTAEVSGLGTFDRPTYHWTVSAGTITAGGQGTSSITVDTTGAGGLTLTATVEVGGLPAGCENKASCATAIPAPIACGLGRIDEYGNINFEDEQARLDNYAIALQNAPGVQGYLVCYGGRRGHRGEAQARCDRAKNYLVGVRQLDATRLVTLDGGFREDLRVELRLVPEGVEPPPPTPTVEPSEVEFVERSRSRRSPRRGSGPATRRP